MATIELAKYGKDGKSAGTVAVSESVFGVAPNLHVLHLAVRRELANGRAGTAKAKTRSEVRGGGRKPWKQKGTGRARAGSIRSPLFAGGGVIFGPQPRDYSFDLPKKVRVLAIKSSLSAASGKFKVIEDFAFLSAPKTKDVAQLLKSLELCGKKVLLLVDYKAQANQNVYLAARNIAGVKISLPSNLSAKDLIEADAVITTQAAVEEINERYADHV
ncbi:MAG: 50S ribosomal protein L4 [Vampirovibrionales bacterium]|nr:50S ribosomal protein L4 [Vampirovibrionales bacterium]